MKIVMEGEEGYECAKSPGFQQKRIQTSTLSLQLYDYRHVYLDAYALALELFTTG